jgi:RNA polymerase sigma factor (sigma-70 family)
MAGRSLRLPWEVFSSDAFGESSSCVGNGTEPCDRVFHPHPERLDLETVYRIRRPEMIRYLIGFGVDLVEAEDVTQEIFLNFFGKAQKTESPDNLFRWALVCAKNLAINRYRRRKCEVSAPASIWKQWEETLPDSRPSAELLLQEEERYRNLTAWVSTLSDVEQKCAVLRSQGIPFREMAAALDLPLRKVVYITSVAIQKLKRQRESQAH